MPAKEMLRWVLMVLGDLSAESWETPVAMHLVLVALVGVLPIEQALPVSKVG